MSPEDLVVALRTAIDETERIAKEATSGPWRVVNPTTYGSATVDGPDAMQDGGYDPITGGRREVLRPLVVIPKDVDYGPTVGLPDAEHIAHHDPAAVLRRVAADREIVALYETARGLLPGEPRSISLTMVVGVYEQVLLCMARGYGIETEVPNEA